MTVEINPSTTASVSTFVNPVALAIVSTISAFVKMNLQIVACDGKTSLRASERTGVAIREDGSVENLFLQFLNSMIHFFDHR